MFDWDKFWEGYAAGEPDVVTCRFIGGPFDGRHGRVRRDIDQFTFNDDWLEGESGARRAAVNVYKPGEWQGAILLMNLSQTQETFNNVLH
jgi:hypothetical protein